jgi:multiple sugar transport system ATP-binding protein
LGLRPEALHFADTGIPVEIEAETPLNEKTITLAKTLRGREIFVSRPAGQPGPKSGRAYLAVRDTVSLLFDEATGARIAPTAQDKEAAA